MTREESNGGSSRVFYLITDNSFCVNHVIIQIEFCYDTKGQTNGKHVDAEKATQVADMTQDELRNLVKSSVRQGLLEMLRDPDEGLELRPEIIESIERQRKEFAAGKRGKSLDQVAKELGLD